MGDLSSWDFLDDFTAFQAASLINGVVPTGEITIDYSFSGPISGNIFPIHQRLNDDFEGAKYDFTLSKTIASCYLRSERLCHLQRLSLAKPESWETNKTWLQHPDSKLEKQLFSRFELTRWLQHHSLKSAYKFDIETSDASQANAAPDKDVGTKERNTLLTIIAVLCKEAKYDITKPAKAANLIQSTADDMGISIGETTIENHLKKIPNALIGRMK